MSLKLVAKVSSICILMQIQDEKRMKTGYIDVNLSNPINMID